MARKYKRGKQIKSVAEFEDSKASSFIVVYGRSNEKTTHRGWIMGWQYHYLSHFIKEGRIYEAELRDDIETKRIPGFIKPRKDGDNAED